MQVAVDEGVHQPVEGAVAATNRHSPHCQCATTAFDTHQHGCSARPRLSRALRSPWHCSLRAVALGLLTPDSPEPRMPGRRDMSWMPPHLALGANLVYTAPLLSVADTPPSLGFLCRISERRPWHQRAVRHRLRGQAGRLTVAPTPAGWHKSRPALWALSWGAG